MIYHLRCAEVPNSPKLSVNLLKNAYTSLQNQKGGQYIKNLNMSSTRF